MEVKLVSRDLCRNVEFCFREAADPLDIDEGVLYSIEFPYTVFRLNRIESQSLPDAPTPGGYHPDDRRLVSLLRRRHRPPNYVAPALHTARLRIIITSIPEL